jgi:hypothetical protein
MTKLVVAFRNFANAPKNEDHLIQSRDARNNAVCSAISPCHLILQPLAKSQSLRQGFFFVENKKRHNPGGDKYTNWGPRVENLPKFY